MAGKTRGCDPRIWPAIRPRLYAAAQAGEPCPRNADLLPGSGAASVDTLSSAISTAVRAGELRVERRGARRRVIFCDGATTAWSGQPDLRPGQTLAITEANGRTARGNRRLLLVHLKAMQAAGRPSPYNDELAAELGWEAKTVWRHLRDLARAGEVELLGGHGLARRIRLCRLGLELPVRLPPSAQRVLDYLADLARIGTAATPSLEEIVEACGLPSFRTASKKLLTLEKAGRITRLGRGTYRQIRVEGVGLLGRAAGHYVPRGGERDRRPVLAGDPRYGTRSATDNRELDRSAASRARQAALPPISDAEREAMLARFAARGGTVTRCPEGFGVLPAGVERMIFGPYQPIGG